MALPAAVRARAGTRTVCVWRAVPPAPDELALPVPEPVDGHRSRRSCRRSTAGPPTPATERSDGGACTRTGVPGVIPCAAPTSSVSPAFTPDAISIDSAVGSRMPSVTSTRSVLPLCTRTTAGRCMRRSTAPVGTTMPLRVALDTLPSA